jgi:bacteriocin-like protein
MTDEDKVKDITEEKELTKEELDKINGGVYKRIEKTLSYCSCSCSSNTASALNKNDDSGA